MKLIKDIIKDNIKPLKYAGFYTDYEAITKEICKEFENLIPQKGHPTTWGQWNGCVKEIKEHFQRFVEANGRQREDKCLWCGELINAGKEFFSIQGCFLHQVCFEAILEYGRDIMQDKK